MKIERENPKKEKKNLYENGMPKICKFAGYNI